MDNYCKKCLLPVNYLGLKISEGGICHHCQNYESIVYLGTEKLKEMIREPLSRNKSQKYDCVIGFSGGRDSSYILWYAVNVLGLKPLAVFSDDLFIPDVAYENLKNATRILCVDLKIVKHNYLKKCLKHHLNAWIKRPVAETLMFINVGERLGYETLVEKEAIKQGVKLIIGGRSPIQSEEKYKTDIIKINNRGGRLSWVLGYIKQVFLNPMLSSNLYCLKIQFLEFINAYLKKRLLEKNEIVTIHPFYEYVQWSEVEIEKILFDKLEWKIPTGAKTSNRIGCEIDTLRQYLYYRILGYNDQNVDLSGMIRDGQITREIAKAKLDKSVDIPRDYITYILTKSGVNACEFMRVLDDKYPQKK